MAVTEESKSALLAYLGLYGQFLLDHGKAIGKYKDKTTKKLLAAYQMFYEKPESGSAGVLISRIDEWCIAHQWPLPGEQ